MEDPGQPRRTPLISVTETCAECGVSITELPFTPRPGSSVYCLPCHKERRGPNRGGPRDSEATA